MAHSPRWRRSWSYLLGGAAAFALQASAASAQEGTPPEGTPSAPPPVVAPAPASVPPAQAEPAAVTPPRAPGESPDDVRFRDAHADRVIFGSTAETHPVGTFFFTDYEILLLQFGYAVTDDLQISLTGLPPLFKNQPYFFDFGLKLNVVRGEIFRAALTGALDVVTTGATGGSDNGPYVGGRLGGVGQFCFEGTCRSSLSISGGAIITSGAKEVLPIYGAAGVIGKVSSLVSLLAEPSLLGALGTGSSGFSSGAFFFLDYGVRLSGKNFGVDLTFIKALATTTGDYSDPLILGYPFVVFTYRTDGSPRGRAANAAASAPNSGSNFASVAPMMTRGF